MAEPEPEQEGGTYTPFHIQEAVAAQKSLESAGVDTAAELIAGTTKVCGRKFPLVPVPDSPRLQLALCSAAALSNSHNYIAGQYRSPNEQGEQLEYGANAADIIAADNMAAIVADTAAGFTAVAANFLSTQLAFTKEVDGEKEEMTFEDLPVPGIGDAGRKALIDGTEDGDFAGGICNAAQVVGWYLRHNGDTAAMGAMLVDQCSCHGPSVNKEGSGT
eukprot:SAG25_NODE_2984_length_1281_cov_1.046531_1_plen_217_part_01